MTGEFPAPSFETQTDETLQKILAALRGLRFGSVEIVIHDGRIVQIERRERMRLNLPCPSGDGAERGTTNGSF
jgi:hypothetical protein